jgi:hypothetical protein
VENVMKYFKIEIENGIKVVEVSSQCPSPSMVPGELLWARRFDGSWGNGWVSRMDYSDRVGVSLPPGCSSAWDFASKLAASASACGAVYIPVDRGPSVFPRYDVVEAPAVGDEVCKAFNGDQYPVGKVVKIGKDYKIVFVDGPRGLLRFYRKKLSGSWLNNGWSLVPGNEVRLNPEF